MVQSPTELYVVVQSPTKLYGIVHMSYRVVRSYNMIVQSCTDLYT